MRTRETLWRRRIRSRIEGRHFVVALIVRCSATKPIDPAHALRTVLPINGNLRIADRLSNFVDHLAGKHGVGRELQGKGFSIEIGAGYDRAGELFVLVVKRTDKPTLLTHKGVSASGNVELETPVVAGNYRLHVFPFQVGDRDPATRKWIARLPIEHIACDVVGGRNQRPEAAFRLRITKAGEHCVHHCQCGQALGESSARLKKIHS